MKYNCLIVDDEAPARQLIASYLKKIPDMTVVALCRDALEAQSILQKTKIDILFMDIEMPELSGVEFLRMANDIPATILITAHADYALEGYELEVVDYLLKPVEFARFFKAVSKAIERVVGKPIAFSHEIENHEDLNYIFVKADKEIIKIDIRSILFIESQREYVEIQTKKQKILTLQSLSKLMDILPDKTFFRVHRSYIVNIDVIDKIIGNTIYIGGHRVLISKGQRQEFMEKINKKKLF